MIARSPERPESTGSFRTWGSAPVCPHARRRLAAATRNRRIESRCSRSSLFGGTDQERRGDRSGAASGGRELGQRDILPERRSLTTVALPLFVAPRRIFPNEVRFADVGPATPWPRQGFEALGQPLRCVNRGPANPTSGSESPGPRRGPGHSVAEARFRSAAVTASKREPWPSEPDLGLGEPGATWWPRLVPSRGREVIPWIELRSSSDTRCRSAARRGRRGPTTWPTR